jgi:hypothetical protein
MIASLWIIGLGIIFTIEYAVKKIIAEMRRIEKDTPIEENE